MPKIKLLSTAIEDLKEILIYISFDNPLQAKKVIEDIHSSIDYLILFPFLWKEIKSWFREIVAKHKYRVVYKVDKEVVYIVSIFKYKDFFNSNK